MNRRKFLNTVFKIGGIAGLAAMGVPLSEIKAIAKLNTYIGGIAPATGGGPCGSGQIAGDNTAYSTATPLIEANYAWGHYFTASQSVDSACTVDFYVDLDNDGASSIKVYVTDSSGNIISTTGTTSATSGWHGPVTLTLSSAITSGNSYGLFVITNGWMYLPNDDSAGIIRDTSGSYATPPDPTSTTPYGSAYGNNGIYITATP